MSSSRDPSFYASRTRTEDEELCSVGHDSRSVTLIPARTGSRQAGTGLPSTSTTHSWQMPIMQNTPRGEPVRGLERNRRTPLASKATARLSPGTPEKLRPSTEKLTSVGRSTVFRIRSALCNYASHIGQPTLYALDWDRCQRCPIERNLGRASRALLP